MNARRKRRLIDDIDQTTAALRKHQPSDHFIVPSNHTLTDSEEATDRLVITNRLKDDRLIRSGKCYSEVSNMSPANRQYFAGLYLERSSSRIINTRLWIAILSVREPIIQSIDAFRELISLIKRMENDPHFETLLTSFNNGKIIPTRQALVNMLTIALDYLDLQIRGVEQGYLSNLLSQLDTTEQLKNIASQMKDMKVRAFIATAHSTQQIIRSDENNALNESVDSLLPPAPPIVKRSVFQRYPRLKWILAGALIGLCVAAIIIASVASAGVIPAALGLGAAIGAGVAITVTSTSLGGIIGTGAKSLANYHKINGSYCQSLKMLLGVRAPQYKPKKALPDIKWGREEPDTNRFSNDEQVRRQRADSTYGM